MITYLFDYIILPLYDVAPGSNNNTKPEQNKIVKLTEGN